jgi:hypothetical protein
VLSGLPVEDVQRGHDSTSRFLGPSSSLDNPAKGGKMDETCDCHLRVTEVRTTT